MQAIALQPSFLPKTPTRLRSILTPKVRALNERRTSQSSATVDLNPVMARVANGDREAFAELYDEVSSAVFGTILKVLRSREHAEEVTQEVFLEIWQKADDWDAKLGAATTWIFMTARRRAIDRVRREQALRNREDKVAPGWAEPSTRLVEDEVTDKEERLEVHAGLSALSDLQRQVIELAYYGDHTYSQVAQILEVPLGTVKTRMRDGLIRLRREFGAAT